MGLYTLKSFDTLDCASKCDQAPGCVAFNLYVERDPSLDPNNANCPNPPSTINYKCTLWGAPVVKEQATNKGQLRAQFQVAITASNGTYCELDLVTTAKLASSILESRATFCYRWLWRSHKSWWSNQCTSRQWEKHVPRIPIFSFQPKPRLRSANMCRCLQRSDHVQQETSRIGRVLQHLCILQRLCSFSERHPSRTLLLSVFKTMGSFLRYEHRTVPWEWPLHNFTVLQLLPEVSGLHSLEIRNLIQDQFSCLLLSINDL